MDVLFNCQRRSIFQVLLGTVSITSESYGIKLKYGGCISVICSDSSIHRSCIVLPGVFLRKTGPGMTFRCGRWTVSFFIRSRLFSDRDRYVVCASEALSVLSRLREESCVPSKLATINTVATDGPLPYWDASGHAFLRLPPTQQFAMLSIIPKMTYG